MCTKGLPLGFGSGLRVAARMSGTAVTLRRVWIVALLSLIASLLLPAELGGEVALAQDPPDTTEAPATVPPATDPPPPATTDAPPQTDPPVTDPPVTDPPVTDPPVTDPPVTDPPATDPPVTDPPATDPPATDPPPPSDPPPADPVPAPVDQPVLVTDDSVAAVAGETITFMPTANDRDPEGEPVNLVSVNTGGTRGTVECATGLNALCSYAAPADIDEAFVDRFTYTCLLYTSPSPRDRQKSRMPSSA